MPIDLRQPVLKDIEAAALRIADIALQTPLIRLNVENCPCEIYLKLENLQPIGSFKIRPAANVIRSADADSLREHGVYTASSGNMAQGVAYAARELGVKATVFSPEGQMNRTKKEAVERLGACLRVVPGDEFWQIILDHGRAGEEGVFIHPVAHQKVIEGNATIGLEIIRQLPDVDTILVPYGGGGLACGVASAVRAVKPGVRVLGCEIDGIEPLKGALAAGHPVPAPTYKGWFAGIAVGPVLEDMWPLVRTLIDGTVAPTLDQVAGAVATAFERNRVIVEGGGAAPIAAALAGLAGGGKIVCVVSGGNIDPQTLTTILEGRTP